MRYRIETEQGEYFVTFDEVQAMEDTPDTERTEEESAIIAAWNARAAYENY